MKPSIITNICKTILYIVIIAVFFVGSLYAHYELSWNSGGWLPIISWVFGAILIFSVD